MDKKSGIFVAGHRGLVGSAFVRRLVADGHEDVVISPADLTYQKEVRDLFSNSKFEYLMIAAAKVGGIQDNQKHPADYLYKNLMIECNLIREACVYNIKKLLFLGSSCIYPKLAPSPIQEYALMTGPLEESNRAYAVAKIAGLELVRAYRKEFGCRFISAMPTNLYGPGDRFEIGRSHVIPEMILKFHTAKKKTQNAVTLLGDGSPLREFLYVDDLAAACVLLMNKYDGELPLNIGSGVEVSILQLSEMVREVVEYKGDIVWDTSGPNGTPRKTLDSTWIRKLGWRPTTGLQEGLKKTYEWFLSAESWLKKSGSG